MKIARYIIERYFSDGVSRVKRKEALEQASRGDRFPGYFVRSTAPENTDRVSGWQKKEYEDKAKPEQARQGIRAIARDLYRIQTDPDIESSPELIVFVHGYNTLLKDACNRCDNIYRYISREDSEIAQKKNLVYIGYRWSSEGFSHKIIANAKALPGIFLFLLGICLVILINYVMWPATHALIKLLWSPAPAEALQQAVPNWLATVLLPLFFRVATSAIAFLAFVIVALVLLRLSVYFRDVYRAINFAVPDLVELMRQIEKELINIWIEDIKHEARSRSEAIQIAKEKRPELSKRIKLNFIGHSMGSLVITNAVRVLSNVFDQRAVDQTPVSEIGRTLSLGRLVLASPDIPVLSIVSNRANNLASSLRRFEEAYLFSNEGDLVLRLASTIANYIFFPSAEQVHGHRLGSLALTNPDIENGKERGIVNLKTLEDCYDPTLHLGKAIANDGMNVLECLFVTRSTPTLPYLIQSLFNRNRAPKRPHTNLSTLFDRDDETISLADLFTFFDCTDYKDIRLNIQHQGTYQPSEQPVALLTRAHRRHSLSFWDYVELMLHIGTQRKSPNRCNVHGGYFDGKYSRELMYRIAFLGFEGMLDAIAHEAKPTVKSAENSAEVALHILDEKLKDKGIEVYLSPLRYRVNVQGKDLAEAKQQMLEKVEGNALVSRV
ncbi:DUF3054 domain-containing protein [cf. Phormidesmis sp. LEGE 11477]|uniref:DUF3054 domain-containing protein n=1 Tax=cf. Phormidesmis sp. LEGE 11477 TaxID=1828680 RepID=UPI00187ED4B5|nr:DUF3054 domain-containing protein [cf. Phormidesmis sp. LEGE 11477]MBE9060150.1 alpha/beta hydrolase [cf. Phormidesmis sp. LEGE 11477]